MNATGLVPVILKMLASRDAMTQPGNTAKTGASHFVSGRRMWLRPSKDPSKAKDEHFETAHCSFWLVLMRGQKWVVVCYISQKPHPLSWC